MQFKTDTKVETLVMGAVVTGAVFGGILLTKWIFRNKDVTVVV